jgi:hypothetical protein
MSRTEVFGSTPYQHELTSPSLSGTWTLSTAKIPADSMPSLGHSSVPVEYRPGVAIEEVLPQIIGFVAK